MDAEHSNNCPDGSVPANGKCIGVGKGMVWGFWMKYTDPNATPDGPPAMSRHSEIAHLH